MLNFCIDINKRVAQQSLADASVYIIDDLYQGDILDISCGLIEKIVDNTYQYINTNNTGALDITLGIKSVMSSSVYANNTLLYNNSTNQFTGSFILTGSALGSYIGSDLDKDVTISFQYRNSNILNTVYQKNVIIKSDLIK